MFCEDYFYEKFLKHSTAVAFCPYRICPLGAHCDHQKGVVTGFALDRGIDMAYRANV